MRRSYLLVLLIFSGFAGLSYELLWVRLLALSMGSTTLSFSVVLAVFFGGLALGSRWAGRQSLVVQRPVARYAAIEALTGVLGLMLLPVMKHLGPLFALIDVGGGVGGLVVRVLVSALILLPPTFLMGATLPFVCAATIERDEDMGRGTGLVYGFNTVGAFLGAYGLTFWMLPALGVTESTLVVAGLNFLVASVAWWQSRKSDGQVAPAPPADQQTPTTSKVYLGALVATFVGGFSATGAQIVWSRFFAIALEGTTYGLGSVLVSVLVGIALGSLVAARWARDGKNLARKAGWLILFFVVGLAAFAMAIPAVVYLLATLHNTGLTGRSLLHVQLAVVWLTLLVPTIASGATLPLLVAVVEHSAGRAGLTLARLFATNTVGCILGSLVVGFGLLPGLGSNLTLYALTVLMVLALTVFLLGADPKRTGALGLVTAGLVIAASFPGFEAREIGGAVSVRQDPFSYFDAMKKAAESVTYFHEGDVATVKVQGSLDTLTDMQVGVQLNGLPQGGRNRFPPQHVFESTLVGAVPWVHAREQRRALVVGLGAGGTVKVLTQLGVGEVEVVELERGVVDAMPAVWGDANPLSDPHVKLTVDDARHRLMVTARRSPHQYDFITSMPAHPWIAASLFTREFFELARGNLAPGGVFTTWFGAPSVGPDAFEPLFGAFTSVFPHWAVYWVGEAGAFYLVGSDEPIVFDAKRFEALAASPVFSGEREERRSPDYLPLHVVAVSDPAHPATASAVNTDDNSLIEFGMRRPLSRPGPEYLDFLPVRWLPAARLQTEHPNEKWLELLEHHLGTPGGRLPAQRQLLSPALERVVKGLEAGASPELVAYARLRVAMLAGHPEVAKLAFAELHSEPLLSRARTFVAEGAPPTQREQLLREQLAAGKRADVLAQLNAWGVSGPDDVLEAGTADDAVSWLFVPALPQLAPEERGAQTRAIAARVAQFAAVPLAERCVEKAHAAGWLELERACEQQVQGLHQQRARALLQQAFDAGAREQFDVAVKQLVAAHAQSPLSTENALLLLRAAVRTRDAASVALAREVLRANGSEAATVDAMQSEAERLRDSELPLVPAPAAPPPEPLSPAAAPTP